MTIIAVVRMVIMEKIVNHVSIVVFFHCGTVVIETMCQHSATHSHIVLVFAAF